MSIKAKDTKQAEKTRKKLKKQLESEEKLITSTALHTMSESKKKWTALHAKERIPLKRESFSLFNENKQPAKTQTKYIFRLLHHLKTEFAKKESLRPFKGRILL